jgi:hypothetical protein
MRSSEVSPVTFDKRRLNKDIVEAISRLTDGKEFLGHDGRKYRLVYSGRKPVSEGFFDLVVKDGGRVASYAVVLIGIS